MIIFETIMIYLVATVLGIYLFNIKSIKRLRKFFEKNEWLQNLIVIPLGLYCLGMSIAGLFLI
jgi:hypothetical protein